MRLLLLYGCLLLWWGTAASQDSSSLSIEANPQLLINPYVDTIHYKASAAIVQTVERFLAGYATQGRGNDFWLMTDYDRYQYPYADIYHQLRSNSKVSLLDLIETPDKRQYVVKLAFMMDGPALKSIYTVLALQQADGTWRLARALDYLTRDWQEQQVGNIRYLISPHHTLDTLEAQRFNRFNDTLAHFFEIPPLTNITYYLATDPVELFRVRGFDYHPVMFKFDKGGQNEVWSSIIYSANNSAWYPHELVHSYTYECYGRDIHRIFDEGLATYLGGSNDLSLEHHLKNVQCYLDNHPATSALELLYQNKEIYNRETASLYAIGGLLCKKALKEKGKVALEQLLQTRNTREDFLTTMEEVFGVQEIELEAFIRQALMAYRQEK